MARFYGTLNGSRRGKGCPGHSTNGLTSITMSGTYSITVEVRVNELNENVFSVYETNINTQDTRLIHKHYDNGS